MYRYFLGVDPDIKGSLAVLDELTGIYQVFDLPSIEVQGKKFNKNIPLLREVYGLLSPYWCGAFATIEQQQPWKTDTPYTAGSLMYSMGIWEMALTIIGIPFLKVLPTEWKPAQLKGYGGLRASKEAAILKAQGLFPLVADQLIISHHGRADSLLLMDYGRSKNVSKK